MKTALACLLLSGSICLAQAATTINVTNKLAYAANVGWMDWRGDTNSGAIVGEYVCSGYIWIANVGWIHLGSNAPANGVQYQNNSATDYGVNHDGLGNLRGFAYGANIGWINFESNGAPRVDLASGRLNGFAYSANCGWISLSNAFSVLDTDRILAGVDTDTDGIADAWERTYTNTLSAFSALSDTDRDGASDRDEYIADTNPLDANSRLRITRLSLGIIGEMELNTLTWTSRPTRRYRIGSSTSLNSSGAFTNVSNLLTPDPGTLTTVSRLFATPASSRFHRVQALKPLQ